MDSKSGVIDASKDLFYQQLAAMNISIDSYDNSLRDITWFIFEEPAIDASHLPQIQDRNQQQNNQQIEGPARDTQLALAQQQNPQNIEEEEKVPEPSNIIDLADMNRADIQIIRRHQEFLSQFREKKLEAHLLRNFNFESPRSQRK